MFVEVVSHRGNGEHLGGHHLAGTAPIGIKINEKVLLFRLGFGQSLFKSTLGKRDLGKQTVGRHKQQTNKQEFQLFHIFRNDLLQDKGEYIGEHYAIAFVADPQRNHVFPGRRVDFGIHIHPSASDNGEVTAEIGCCRLSPVAPDAYQGIGNRFRSQQLLDTRGGPGNIQSLLFLQFL